MKKRIVYIIVPCLLFTGVLAGLIVSQMSAHLPGEAQDVLDSYLAVLPEKGGQKSAVFAQDSDRFSAEMGRELIHAPVKAYRSSPFTNDGEIIQPLEDTVDLKVPAQEVWCVAVGEKEKTADIYFLARYENLYDSTWVLFESRSGKAAAQTIGCNLS